MTVHTVRSLRSAAFALAGTVLLALPLAASATSSVTVTVVGGHIVLTPDPLPVGAGHNVLLTWTIATAGWTFAGDGIDVDGNDGEFGAPQVAPDGHSVQETDKDDNGTAYKYTVTLTDGTHTLTVDPTIQNGGH
jgi:hypothetical protein